MPIVFYDSEQLAARLDLAGLIDYLGDRHRGEKGETADCLLGGEGARYLVRSATGPAFSGTKMVTIVPSNATRGIPTVQAIFAVFERATGTCVGILDATQLTYWKTAADSGLGSRYLSRSDARTLLICGAGGLAPWLVRGHIAARPSIDRVIVWNRTYEKAALLAKSLCDEGLHAAATRDLEPAVHEADIVVTATLAREPFLQGEWLRSGQHVDLVGSFGRDTREADDDCMRRAKVFVDSKESALHGVGDILGPLASGALTRDEIVGDLYDLARGCAARTSTDDITLFKNAGGAHLDLMTAEYLMRGSV